MKNRLIVSILLLEAVLAGTFGFLRYQAFQTAAHAPIVFGFIAPPFEEAPGNYAVEDRKSKQLAIDEINKAGGIDGHPIEAAWEDGACEAKAAGLAAQKLVDRGAVAILTGPCTTETLAAAAVTQPARIPLLASMSPGKAVSFAGDLVYRMTYSDASEGEMVAGYLAKVRSMKSVVILSGISEAERERRAGFVRKSAIEGLVISVDQSVTTLKDVTPSLLVSVQRAKPEAVYLNIDDVSTNPNDPSIAKALAQQLGWYNVNVPIIVTDLSGQWDGVLVTGEYLWSTNPTAAAVLTGYQSAYGQFPSDPALMSHAYDSVYVLAETIERVGTNAKDIQAYLNDPNNSWETSFGTTTFDQNGDALYSIHVGFEKYP